MNTQTFIAAAILASLTIAAAPARAADTPEPAPVSRAVVLAELQIYRESGLASASQSELAGNVKELATAQAKSAQLRRSPYFAALVNKYGEGQSQVETAAR